MKRSEMAFILMLLLINIGQARPRIFATPNTWSNNAEIIKGTVIEQPIVLSNEDSIAQTIRLTICLLPPETAQRLYGFGGSPLSALWTEVEGPTCREFITSCNEKIITMQPNSKAYLIDDDSLRIKVPDEYTNDPITGLTLWSGTGRYVLAVFLTGEPCPGEQGYTVYEGTHVADLYIIEKEENKCGNNIIDIGENCQTCPLDVTCKPTYQCEYGECIPTDITPICGNGVCERDEAINCQNDCEKPINYTLITLSVILIIAGLIITVGMKKKWLKTR